jgi:hypothetical protein
MRAESGGEAAAAVLDAAAVQDRRSRSLLT